MAVTVVGVTYATNAGNTLSITTPTGTAENDLLLLCQHPVTGEAVTPGWTRVDSHAYSGSFPSIGVLPSITLYSRPATASEPSTQVIQTEGSGDKRTGLLFALRSTTGVPNVAHIAWHQSSWSGCRAAGTVTTADVLTILSVAFANWTFTEWCSNPTDGSPEPNANTVPVFSDGAVNEPGIIAGVLESQPAGTWRFSHSGDAVGGLQSVVAHMVFEDAPVPPPLPESVVKDPRDRLRSSVSADSGSILAAARAVPFDTSHSITFNPTQRLAQTSLYSFREVTRAQNEGPVDAVFFPRAVQNTQEERAYDGVTTLSLMGRVFPPPLVGQATTLGLANATATSWVEYAFQQWALEYPWFTYEPVPDLRHPIPGSAGTALPSEYGATDGVVTTDAIAFRQKENERVSMLEMLESLLSPFPGTVFFVNSSGNLQLVPAYGPDADEGAYITLTDDLVSRQSLGEPSAFGIINRATVATRGLTAGLTAVMKPAWYQVGARDLFGFLEDDNTDRVWFDPRAAAVNLQPPTNESLVLQEELTPASAFTAQTIIGWPITDPELFTADAIRLVDDLGDPLVTAAFRRFNVLGGTAFFAASGAGTLVLTREDVPTDGVWRRTLDWSTTVGLVTFRLYMDARWNAFDQTVEWRIGDGSGDLAWNGASFERIRLVVEFTLDDFSEGFVETPGPNVTYGVEGQALFEGSISESQDVFGVLEERLDVRGYYLDAEQALAVAQGYVLANIQPRATREVELGWLGSTQVLLDDRGRRAQLPSGEVGRLVGVSYSDDFVSVSGTKGARVEVEIPGAPGSLPTGGLLLNDDGSFWQNDDGSTSEVA